MTSIAEATERQDRSVSSSRERPHPCIPMRQPTEPIARPLKPCGRSLPVFSGVDLPSH
jgi:hypothetical protein